jgi:hypothetical protein
LPPDKARFLADGDYQSYIQLCCFNSQSYKKTDYLLIIQLTHHVQTLYFVVTSPYISIIRKDFSKRTTVRLVADHWHEKSHLITWYAGCIDAEEGKLSLTNEIEVLNLKITKNSGLHITDLTKIYFEEYYPLPQTSAHLLPVICC